MKLSTLVFPALAFGITNNRRSIQDFDVVDNQFLKEFFDSTFDELADKESLNRSSRDPIGWNRNVNHGFEREQRLRSNRPASNRPPSNELDFIINTGNYSVDDIIEAMARIRARQERIRRMKLVRKLEC